MKSKLFSTFSTLRVLMVAALTVFCVSCDKTETTDSTGFILYYMGVTDIGPGLSYDLQAPAYKGSAPYDFTITNIMLNEETFSNNENFVINTETGAIAIQNTGAMASGLYSISVGCYSNGKFFEFKDAVQVNMLLAAPEGVTIEPDKIIVVNQDEEKWAETSAQVTTEKDKHISILGYAIAQDENKPYLQYFDVTSTGKIIIKEGVTEDQLIAGEEYTLSLKLTTKVGDHMFADAVTFKVVSKPRKLVYDLGERGYNLYEEKLAWETDAPQFKGGKEDLKFAIKSITPEVSGFIINETTGQISLPENHTVAASENIYSFTITVSNSYGTVDFENVYKAKVITKITPIENFSYEANKTIYQLGGELTVARADGFTGDPEKFIFAADNTDEEVLTHYNKGIILIDRNDGTITIANNHTLSVGNHTIKVEASNMKGSVTAELTVDVLENPNDFTYVSWGTNIENELVLNQKVDLSIKKETNIDNRNQFRYLNNNDLPTEEPITIKSDLPSANFTYTIIKRYPDGAFVNTKTDLNGSIILGANATTKNNGGILVIKVTAEGNGAPAVSKNIPIFFATTSVTDSKTVIFTPFAIRVDTHTKDISQTSCRVIKYGNKTFRGEDEGDITKLALDYRRKFKYIDFEEDKEHKSGELTDASFTNKSVFLATVWSNCSSNINGGSRVPLSNHMMGNGMNSLEAKAGYIDKANRQININLEKWKDQNGQYPYGAVDGDILYNLNSDYDDIHVSSGSKSTTIHPLYIWFDKNHNDN